MDLPRDTACTIFCSFADLMFDANCIFIHGGVFSVGSEAQPFRNQLTVTLHGDRYSSIEIPTIGTKCLAAMDTEPTAAGDPAVGATGPAPTNAGALATATANRFRAFSRGTIDVHGAPRRRVWTMLGAHVRPGSSRQGAICRRCACSNCRITPHPPLATAARSVCTSDPVDFAPGERIVVSSSDRDFTHAEEAEIVQVFNSTCFSVNITFRWFHRGTQFSGATFSWDTAIDNRAEVGLLTRSELSCC